MPVAGPQLGEAVRGMLAERGVGYHPDHAVRGAEGGVLAFEGRDPVTADLVVAIPRHVAPIVTRTAGVANDAGWAVVDPRALVTKDPSIFAIGDCASIAIPGRWNPNTPLSLPKAGVFAHAKALALAGRLEALINGTPNPRSSAETDSACWKRESISPDSRTAISMRRHRPRSTCGMLERCGMRRKCSSRSGG